MFVVGQDPVRAGLVESMNRPGKATGVNFFTGDLGVSGSSCSAAWYRRRAWWGCCLTRTSGTRRRRPAPRCDRDRVTGARLPTDRGKRATDDDIEAGFVALAEARVTALVMQNDPFFDSRRSQIIALSSRHRLPGIFHIREFPAAGGLMSYGASLSETYRQVGKDDAGKLLRGAKADDLPVLRPTKFELVVNRRLRRHLALPYRSPF